MLAAVLGSVLVIIFSLFLAAYARQDTNCGDLVSSRAAVNSTEINSTHVNSTAIERIDVWDCNIMRTVVYGDVDNYCDRILGPSASAVTALQWVLFSGQVRRAGALL